MVDWSLIDAAILRHCLILSSSCLIACICYTFAVPRSRRLGGLTIIREKLPFSLPGDRPFMQSLAHGVSLEFNVARS
jgi:hypothetical protein